MFVTEKYGSPGRLISFDLSRWFIQTNSFAFLLFRFLSPIRYNIWESRQIVTHKKREKVLKKGENKIK